MLSITWTREELLANAVAIETTVWRVVEAQYRVSTMKLVDSVEEQELLENLIEESKPVIPDTCEGLHYLLSAPFRYATTNLTDSRFRKGGDPRGVFYASGSPETAISEIAYYRMLFFTESPDTPLPTNSSEYTAFAVQVTTNRCIDLTRSPFEAHKEAWGHTNDYSECQRLAATARETDIEIICYPSVRDPKHRMNYAVLTPRAFSQKLPSTFQTWHIHLRKKNIVAKCECPHFGLSFSFQ